MPDSTPGEAVPGYCDDAAVGANSDGDRAGAGGIEHIGTGTLPACDNEFIR